MSFAREILAKFSVSFDTHELKHGDDLVNKTVEGLKHLAHEIAALVALHQIEAWATQFANAADDFATAADIAGVAAGELQKLEHAANMLDVAPSQVRTGLKFLQRNLYEAQHGSKEAAESFSSLGVDLKSLSTADPVQQFRLLGEKIREQPNHFEKTALAMRLFGRSGSMLIPMFNESAESIDKYVDEIEHLGGGYDKAGLDAADRLTDHEKQLALLKRSIGNLLLKQIVPGLLAFGHQVERLGKWFLEANKNGELLKLGILAFVGIGITRIPALIGLIKHLNWQFMITFGLFLALGIAAEDLITWFSGGDSVIGRFFGAIDPAINDAAKVIGDFVAFITSSWANLGKGLVILPSAIGMAFRVLDTEVTNGVSMLVAWVLDQWDRMIQALHLPSWIEKGLTTANAGKTGGNVGVAREEGARAREEAGKEFINETENTKTWTDFKAAAGAKRQADLAQAASEGWQKQGGEVGKFRWDMTQNAPVATEKAPPPPKWLAKPKELPMVHGAGGDHATAPGGHETPTTGGHGGGHETPVAGHETPLHPPQQAVAPVKQEVTNRTIQIHDNSKHETHVTVPGTTSANMAAKTAQAVGRAERNANRQALAHLEHRSES